MLGGEIGAFSTRYSRLTRARLHGSLVDELPRNATGKVLERWLRSRFVGDDAPKIS